MQYLYVCLFSNGHIKAGRSISPESRIASHESRVSCLGVELVEYRTFPCASHVIPAEHQMLSLCCAAAQKVNKNEWFVGLDFLDACEFASVASQTIFAAGYEPKTGAGMRARDFVFVIRTKHKLTQQQVSERTGIPQPTVSKIERGDVDDVMSKTYIALQSLHDELEAAPQQT